MKRQIKLYILLALLSFIMVSPASAGGWIFGANTGTMNVDISGVSNPKNVGFMAGYEIGVVLGDLAFEGEITRTTSPGKYLGSDVKLETEALYVALRTAGPIYFKGRAGTIQSKLKAGSTDNDSSSSYSIGVGFSLGLVQAELDYTQVNNDINYVSIGVVF